jgi:hypothetical protein
MKETLCNTKADNVNITGEIMGYAKRILQISQDSKHVNCSDL